MGFFDKLTGTRHPQAGAAPRPAEESRTALLGLNLPDGPEVRAVQEQWEVTRVGNPPRLKTSATYERGGGRTVSRQYTLRRGESGRLEATESFSFDSARLMNPLRTTTLASGWTWRGVIFGKL